MYTHLSNSMKSQQYNDIGKVVLCNTSHNRNTDTTTVTTTQETKNQYFAKILVHLSLSEVDQ